MINFSAGAANILGACRAAEIDTILTSRAFVEKGRLDNLVAQLEKVGAHRLSGRHSQNDRHARQAPRPVARSDKPLVARKPDDWGVILFTSGTEGLPKGVVLSHRNVLTNVAQCAARIDFGREDKRVQCAADLPLVRLHRRRGAAADFRRADLPLSVAAALSHRARTGLRRMRHRAVRHRYVPQRLCAHGQSVRLPLACVTSWPAPSRCANRRGKFIWKSSACAFSKATA